MKSIMTDSIYVVNFDLDGVCYKGISTSHVADRSTSDATGHLSTLLSKGWFTSDDVQRWSNEYNGGKPVLIVPDLARCLTDFLYKMKRPETDQSVITKEQTIEGKQMILGGITLGEVKAAADAVPWAEGLEEALYLLALHGRPIKVYGSSDGLGPFVCYQMQRLDFDDKGYVPALVNVDNEEKWFEAEMLQRGDITLTGKVGKYDKAAAFFQKMQEGGILLSAVAAIDDSGANVESLLLPIQQAGGVAIGYNPTDAHMPTFQKHSIPILKGTNLGTFGEIVSDRSKIGQYCE
jgi:hypothetical protein